MAALPDIVLGALVGIAALGIGLARCSWQRARLRAEDVRELATPGGPSKPWLAAVREQAAIGMVAPETVSELVSRGLVDGAPDSSRWRMRLASGRSAMPSLALFCVVACCSSGALRGSAPATLACGAACASACLDWAHRTVSPALCAGQALLGLWSNGGCDPLVLATALAATSLQVVLAIAGRGAVSGTGDCLLVPAWALCAPGPAQLLAGLLALGLTAAVCMAALGRSRRVPLAPMLVLPLIVMEALA